MQRADESSSSSATPSENSSYRFFLATGLFPYPPAISSFGSGSTLPANNQQSPTSRRPSDFSPHSLALLTNRHIAYPTPTGKQPRIIRSSDVTRYSSTNHRQFIKRPNNSSSSSFSFKSLLIYSFINLSGSLFGTLAKLFIADPISLLLDFMREEWFIFGVQVK